MGYDTLLADDPAQPGRTQPHVYYASGYFDFMYRAAQYLIEAGHAYVDEQTPEQMRAARGDFNTPGIASPYRDRTPAENLVRFQAIHDTLSPVAPRAMVRTDKTKPGQPSSPNLLRNSGFQIFM